MHKILGLDIGKATIGVSLSDLLGITAQPKGTIRYENSNKEEFVQELLEIVKIHKPGKIVYGLPLNMDGTKSDTTLYVEEVIEMAKDKISLEFISMDERWTSKAAEKAIINAGFKKSQRKEKNDEIASSLILQSYLDSQI